MLAIYSLTCPAPSAYWGRTGLCCIQVTAQRIRLTLPPCKPHPHRESHEESPERRVSLAQSGAAAVPLPHFAPAYSPRKTWQSQCVHAKALFLFAADSVPRSPRSFVFRRDRHKETLKPKLNQPSSITAPTIRERTTGDLDPRRNRNATFRKPSCLAPCGKQQA